MTSGPPSTIREPELPNNPSIHALDMADLLLENTTPDRPTMTRTDITRAWIALSPEDNRPHRRANGGGGSLAATRICRALTTLEKPGTHRPHPSHQPGRFMP